MLLVLCSIADDDALCFADRSRRAGVPVTVVTGELLAFARRRSHRLGRAGVHSSIELGDGTVLSDLTLTGVLNRLVEPPAAAWEHAAVGERAYAMAELHAFALSWLTSLPCPVRNRPDPSYLAGPAPHPLLALAAARSVGLRTVPIRLDTSTAGAGYDGTASAIRRTPEADLGAGGQPVHVVCLDGAPIAPGWIPGEVAERIRQLGPLIGTSEALVGLDFTVDVDRPADPAAWCFAGLAPLARLRVGGPRLLSTLRETLAAGSASGIVRAGEVAV